MTRVVPLALLLLCACGLGNGAIFLTVDGRGPLMPLVVPDDVDALHVRVVSDASKQELLDKTYTLMRGDSFPFTLGLEPGSQTGARVRIAVTALKADAMVTETEALVAMNPRELTEVTMVLSVP